MSSRSLPVMMRETSRTSLISCSCSARVALDRLEDRRKSMRLDHPAADHLRVPEHRVERRAQLVRQRRQEFVLEPVR